ncbi:MAG: DUF421 domain-containing protein [Chloroflexota bacterium]|nr:DUF421 domain-containing protein [Anaerolineales bacterium]MCA9977942.1 DUF421 domain-containing protein [Anaerolineales bacterium]MCB8965477.1 DUF421 domain-containing protein [Ardenticatenaceae bacterium]
MFDLDWHGIFAPSVPILEIMLRGTVVYLVLFVVLRLTLKRVGGTIGLADVLMIALVAAAAQNAIAREHHSITDGVVLVTTIAIWSYVLDWMGHRYPWFQTFYSPPPLLLVKDGRMLYRNMRTELITEDELMSYIRRAGVQDLADVREAYMEGDGSVTVIEREG